MSKYGVSQEKEYALLARMEELHLSEEELEEKFIKGSGPGGQKINKSSSCVYLLHKPSGEEVKCQRTRSQALNRYYARVQLCDRIEEKRLGKASRLEQERERIRRQKRRRSRRAKERTLEEKKKQSKKKTQRKPVGAGDE